MFLTNRRLRQQRCRYIQVSRLPLLVIFRSNGIVGSVGRILLTLIFMYSCSSEIDLFYFLRRPHFLREKLFCRAARFANRCAFWVQLMKQVSSLFLYERKERVAARCSFVCSLRFEELSLKKTDEGNARFEYSSCLLL